MFVAATAGILISMTLAMVRALLGPTVYDRVLAVNTFGTKTVLLIAALGFLTGRPEFLDRVRAHQLHCHNRRAEVLRVRGSRARAP